MVSRNSRTRRNVLAVSLAFAAPLTAAPAFAEGQATDLDGVVVTGTRTAVTQDATLVSTSVITRADIERLQPASLLDVLRTVPGMSISNNGGSGKESSLFVRGAESDHLLVLVDGIKVGSATAGKAALQDIPVEQIERIEIVRGPFSSLYGSEALGGVLQVFTRRPQSGFSPEASVAVGNLGARRATAGVGGRSERAWYQLNLAHDTTDGINACRPAPTPFAGCGVDEPDRDGYTNNSVSAQVGYRFSEAWDADAHVLQADGRNEYDGSFTNESDVVQQVGGARVGYSAGALKLTAKGGQAKDRSRDFHDEAFMSAYETLRSMASLQADISADAGVFSVGVDWLRDEVDSTDAYDVGDRTNRALFGQWQRAFGAHALQAAVRRDDNEQFGGKTTGSVAWGWDLNEALRLTARYGTAFKAPSFNDLYYPFFGNPNLQPETSATAEVGLRGKHGWGGWSVNAYQSRVDDLIGYDPTLIDATHPWGQPNNIDRARIRGVELSADTVVAGWDLRASVGWLDARDDSGGFNQDNVLPRRPRQSGRVDADRRFGRFSAGASVQGVGERFDEVYNTTRLPGYATTDLRVGWTIDEAWALQLTASNVFDREYETAAYYRQPGHTYLLTLRYRAAR